MMPSRPGPGLGAASAAAAHNVGDNERDAFSFLETGMPAVTAFRPGPGLGASAVSAAAAHHDGSQPPGGRPTTIVTVAVFLDCENILKIYIRSRKVFRNAPVDVYWTSLPCLFFDQDKHCRSASPTALII